MNPAILSWWREVVVGLFPFLARFRTRPAIEGGALEIKSAAGRVELEGGVLSVLRVGDGGRLVFDPGIPGTTPPGLYYSPNGTALYAPVATVTPGSTVGGTVPTLLGSTPGTAIAPTGSGKVFAG